MTEMSKTILFVAAAVGCLFLAFAVRPASDTFDAQELIGERLNQFEVDAAKRLKIVKFDRETASQREFEIAESDGLWSLPSKQGYPADAHQQMAEAVNNVIDREILRVAAQTAKEHQTLGVLNPDNSKLTSKSTGVGTRVVISDVNENVLADMIIGQPVPESENQYYVRNTDQDVVYVVNLNPENLSTRFKDWIEGDLLQLNPLDLRQVEIQDYSVELRPVLTAGGFQMQILWERRGEMELEYDDKTSSWSAQRLATFDAEQQKMLPYELGDNEELNQDTLQELRSSLEDLQIVDVERKPDGLSADLRAGEGFLQDSRAQTSLAEKGFAPVAIEAGSEPEILSSEGQLTCSLQDGVQYVLRFGNLKADSQETDESTTADETASAGSEAAGDDIYRYLFVMARFEESLLDSPELDGFPELPEGVTEADLEQAAEATDNTTRAAESASAAADTNAGDAAADAAEASESEDTLAEDEAEENAAEDVAENEAATEASPEELAQQAQIQDILAERQRITRENQRRQDEYQERVEAGRKRVQTLNERFGDWYYVIDNTVYNKIHLGVEQVTREREAETETEADQDKAVPAS